MRNAMEKFDFGSLGNPKKVQGHLDTLAAEMSNLHKGLNLKALATMGGKAGIVKIYEATANKKKIMPAKIEMDLERLSGCIWKAMRLNKDADAYEFETEFSPSRRKNEERMTTVRDIIGRIEEAKRQPKDEASKAFVFLGAVQNSLEKSLDGWKFTTEGHRGGEMKGAPKGEDEQDDFALQGRGPDGASIMIASVSDRDAHQAIAFAYGPKDAGGKMIKRKYEDVKPGDAKKVASDVIAALKKAGAQIKESALRTVADMLGEVEEK